ncbi:hypothetical protein [Nonomuraea sp. NPDC049695]|uniref:hypothetical protein n=1 Tax=Nonomuraea sp. NPDC049695 TaxID=3154734 RepID=UPI003419BD60
MVSTGRMHGFESLEEQKLLLALDFAGAVMEVLPQPFRLRFEADKGFLEHVPDFLAVLRDGPTWLFDVRPASLIRDRDDVAFAATTSAPTTSTATAGTSQQPETARPAAYETAAGRAGSPTSWPLPTSHPRAWAAVSTTGRPFMPPTRSRTTTGPAAGSIPAADLVSCAAGQVEDAAATLWPGEPFLVHCQVPTITGYVQRIQVGDRHLYAKLSILGVSLVSLLRGLYGRLEDVAREQRVYAVRTDNLPRREACQLAFPAELGRPRVCELAGVHGAALFTAPASGPSMADVLAAAPERTADLLGEVMQELGQVDRAWPEFKEESGGRRVPLGIVKSK